MLVEGLFLKKDWKQLENTQRFNYLVFTTGSVFQFATPTSCSLGYRHTDFCFCFLSWYVQAPSYFMFSCLLFLLLFLQIFTRLVPSHHLDFCSEGFLTIQSKKVVPPLHYIVTVFTFLWKWSWWCIYLFTCCFFPPAVNSMKMGTLPVLFTTESSGLRTVLDTQVDVQ